MKIYITGAELEEFGNLYKIRYHDEIIAETTDRWNAIVTCLNKETLESLLQLKQSQGVYNNSSK